MTLTRRRLVPSTSRCADASVRNRLVPASLYRVWRGQSRPDSGLAGSHETSGLVDHPNCLGGRLPVRTAQPSRAANVLSSGPYRSSNPLRRPPSVRVGKETTTDLTGRSATSMSRGTPTAVVDTVVSLRRSAMAPSILEAWLRTSWWQNSAHGSDVAGAKSRVRVQRSAR